MDMAKRFIGPIIWEDSTKPGSYVPRKEPKEEAPVELPPPQSWGSWVGGGVASLFGGILPTSRDGADGKKTVQPSMFKRVMRPKPGEHWTGECVAELKKVSSRSSYTILTPAGRGDGQLCVHAAVRRHPRLACTAGVPRQGPDRRYWPGDDTPQHLPFLEPHHHRSLKCILSCSILIGRNGCARYGRCDYNKVTAQLLKRLCAVSGCRAGDGSTYSNSIRSKGHEATAADPPRTPSDLRPSCVPLALRRPGGNHVRIRVRLLEVGETCLDRRRDRHRRGSVQRHALDEDVGDERRHFVRERVDERRDSEHRRVCPASATLPARHGTHGPE